MVKATASRRAAKEEVERPLALKKRVKEKEPSEEDKQETLSLRRKW